MMKGRGRFPEAETTGTPAQSESERGIEEMNGPKGNLRKCRGRRRIDENGKKKRPRKTMTTAFSPGVTLLETFFRGIPTSSCIVKGPCTECDGKVYFYEKYLVLYL